MSSSKPAPAPANKPHSVLPLWMRQSLEHLSMKTNLEDYGTSPPENESLFLHEGKLTSYTSSLTAQPPKAESVPPAKTSSLVFKAKELAPRVPRNLTAAPQSSIMVGDQVCPSSAPQSAATTPSVSPQQSPTLIRKILSSDSHCKAGSKLSDGARKVLVVPVTRVTNFDLNAVSPTSW
ncbi:uncharacterized protein LOC100898434 [Galendromus occidentalis]|uniref:Uncharacterized protein LOC100898434 n=1 Tax=Galendromus occidentalis TaxID=34638 RepID=A0AAJ6QX62_9ACAR|nr:uncharacterized protein LOC100898434 [Galendromus occidentalis]